MKKYILLGVLFALTSIGLFAQEKTDSHIIGHVVSEGKHLPFVSVSIKGTTIGTLTDETGHFRILNVPLGSHTVVASSLSFIPKSVVVSSEKSITSEIKFDLEEDILNINEIVVSSDRSEQKRTEAPVIVSTLSSKLFEATQSTSLGEGLVFTPGIRLENNCQNCGFSQVRLNGMEGSYSQILINSRPIFSGLAGVYGLELIPANMIEKVEVVRGGGSAMFGSNAIAGTINVILKDPAVNSFEIGGNYSLLGVGLESAQPTPDYSLNFNTSVLSKDGKSGMSLFGFSRERSAFDSNEDSFSEMAQLENLTLGSRFYHKFGYRGKLSIDLFNIKEERNGGNMQNYPLHEREIAEALSHDIKTVALNYDQFFRQYDLLSVYLSGQYLERDSYYGANKSLSDYGHSTDFTYNIGVQYKIFLGSSSIITGLERTAGRLKDEKLGYPDLDNLIWSNGSVSEIQHTPNTIIAHQKSISTGLFAQYELKLLTAKVNLGARLDQYEISGLSSDSDSKTGLVFSPRISLMQALTKDIQARISYAQGFRAPQIYDEDLHIETSGARQVYHENDPDLIQESSHSLTASLDFNGELGSVYTGFLIEGFSTWLINPFVNIIADPDENGQVVYTRTNAEDGAKVQGINMELKMNFGAPLLVTSGLTIQRSLYQQPQDFDVRQFLRTPNRYGYLRLDYQVNSKSGVNFTTTYTGSMFVPYFGLNSVNPEVGELRESEEFLDMGLRVYYKQKLNGLYIEWFSGIKNIFNAYQKDFDIGIDRDPAYIYGPMTPRTIYFGVKISNLGLD